MTAGSLDALLVTSLPNILYLTNFSGTAAVVVIERESGRLRFITDSRYTESVRATGTTDRACPGLELVVTASSYDATAAAVLDEYRGRRVGFEASHLTVSRHAWLLSTLAAAGNAGVGLRASPELVPTQGLVEAGRVRKDTYELDVLREAGRRLSEVARVVLKMPLHGRTEMDVAADIDWQLRQAGFERPAFDTIVASGPNSALPHARPTERRIGESDLVVLDFGGVYGSYCVDLTRTRTPGVASPRALAVHEAVLEAQRRAISAVAPGVSRFEIDAAARQALAEVGLQDAFGHGTGHGLGIEIHEAPRIVQRRPDVDARDEMVEAGMVFTIEPGAYIPGWGGVRIEDDVIVTDQGAEMLTNVATGLTGA